MSSSTERRSSTSRKRTYSKYDMTESRVNYSESDFDSQGSSVISNPSIISEAGSIRTMQNLKYGRSRKTNKNESSDSGSSEGENSEDESSENEEENKSENKDKDKVELSPVQTFDACREEIVEFCINQYGRHKQKHVDFNSVLLYTMNNNGHPLFLTSSGLIEDKGVQDLASYILKIMPGSIDIPTPENIDIPTQENYKMEEKRTKYQNYVDTQNMNYKRTVEQVKNSLTSSSTIKLYHIHENQYVELHNDDFQFLPHNDITFNKIYTALTVKICVFIEGKKYYICKGKEFKETKASEFKSSGFISPMLSPSNRGRVPDDDNANSSADDLYDMAKIPLTAVNSSYKARSIMVDSGKGMKAYQLVTGGRSEALDFHITLCQKEKKDIIKELDAEPLYALCHNMTDVLVKSRNVDDLLKWTKVTIQKKIEEENPNKIEMEKEEEEVKARSKGKKKIKEEEIDLGSEAFVFQKIYNACIGTDDMFWVNVDIEESRIQLYQKTIDATHYLYYAEEDDTLRLSDKPEWLMIQYQSNEREMTENMTFKIMAGYNYLYIDSEAEKGYTMKDPSSLENDPSLFHLKSFITHDILDSDKAFVVNKYEHFRKSSFIHSINNQYFNKFSKYFEEYLVAKSKELAYVVNPAMDISFIYSDWLDEFIVSHCNSELYQNSLQTFTEKLTQVEATPIGERENITKIVIFILMMISYNDEYDYFEQVFDLIKNFKGVLLPHPLLVLIVQRAVLKVSENPFVHSKNQTCCMSEIFSPFLGVGDIYEDNSSSSYDLPSISQESKSRTIYNYSDDEDSMISVSVLQNNTEFHLCLSASKTLR